MLARRMTENANSRAVGGEGTPRLDRERLTDATLDQFIIAADMTDAWGPVVRTLVAEIRSERAEGSDLARALAAKCRMLAERWRNPYAIELLAAVEAYEAAGDTQEARDD